MMPPQINFAKLGLFASGLILCVSGLNAQPDLLNVMTNGNVGIGLSTPIFPLDISADQGVMRMTSTAAINGSVIELKNTTASPTFLGAINFSNAAGSTPGQIGYAGVNALTFRTNGSEKMRITANGDVGIGTSAPSHKLHVIGSVTSGAVGHFVNTASNNHYGVYGAADLVGGHGYGGYFKGGSYGAYGLVATNNDDENEQCFGLYGSVYTEIGSLGSFNVGVKGEAKDGKTNYGVWGIAWGGTETSEKIGVYGWGGGSGTVYAGYFEGNVHVSGTLSKSSGSFKIDHPLDPSNKYLCHSFVESPDMMNIYNGNVVTNSDGLATIRLPEYFEALNKDFRYQLTVIGQFAQAIINDKIKNNQFTIRTNQPNIEVSWQVTGIRQDAYANAHRIQVEEFKPAHERNKYLNPELFGMPRERGVGYQPQSEVIMKP